MIRIANAQLWVHDHSPQRAGGREDIPSSASPLRGVESREGVPKMRLEWLGQETAPMLPGGGCPPGMQIDLRARDRCVRVTCPLGTIWDGFICNPNPPTIEPSLPPRPQEQCRCNFFQNEVFGRAYPDPRTRELINACDCETDWRKVGGLAAGSAILLWLVLR